MDLDDKFTKDFLITAPKQCKQSDFFGVGMNWSVLFQCE
jgi:hypothetical protein